MSATNRGSNRIENDFYATPSWCTKAIVEKIDWGKVVHVEEPCRGDGAIVQNLPAGSYGMYCHEIREGWDYLKAELNSVELVITNPPYNLATEFLTRSLEQGLCSVYLLRINYLGSVKRKKFLSENRPTHLYTLSKRPSFVDVCAGKDRKKGCGAMFQKKDALVNCPHCNGWVKEGTDATEYAWICWDKGEIMIDKPGIYFL